MFNKSEPARPVSGARALMDGRPAPAPLTSAAAIQAPSAKPDVQPGSITYPLSKPLTGHRGDVRDLVFKDPGAAFIMRHGLPWRRIMERTESGDTRIEVKFDHVLMSRYMAEMTGLDEGLLGTMSGRDVFACWNIVMTLTLPMGNLESS